MDNIKFYQGLELLAAKPDADSKTRASAKSPAAAKVPTAVKLPADAKSPAVTKATTAAKLPAFASKKKLPPRLPSRPIIKKLNAAAAKKSDNHNDDDDNEEKSLKFPTMHPSKPMKKQPLHPTAATKTTSLQKRELQRKSPFPSKIRQLNVLGPRKLRWSSL